MAAGEYVSVSSQADTEQADLVLERTELAADEDAEQRELAAIYVRRGLEPALARTVAQQLMAHDALGAHARDELGLSDQLAARPLQAALASAATFAVGALLPILAVMLPPEAWVVPVVSGASLICLAALGALATQVGGGQRGAGRCASPSGAPWPWWPLQAWVRFSARRSDKRATRYPLLRRQTSPPFAIEER
jgi:VIT1/CCC1 family predicted Fe2+/Mn2+ transporter